MDAIAEAEVYFGFGIPRVLFVEARNLRWVHSAAAGVGTLRVIDDDAVADLARETHAQHWDGFQRPDR